MCRKTILITLILLLSLGGIAVGQPTGKILLEWWLNITGSAVTNLTANTRYPNSPDGSWWPTEFRIPRTKPAELAVLVDNYGARMRGYLHPPATGDYTFWVTADNGCEFWLSTDENPANIKLTCQVSGSNYTGEAEWTKYPEQKSALVALQAGKKYYVEVRFKEGTGGDGLVIAWGGPTIGAGPVTIAGQYLSQFIREVDKMAGSPNPPNGSYQSATFITLQWTAGVGAATHDVFFGDKQADVQAGTGGTFRGNFPATWYMVGIVGYPYPNGLDLNKTYYWRIDEIEADGVTRHAGNVWSFTVPPRTAFNPQPTDGMKYLPPDTKLSWMAGFGAKLHYVYFGTNYDTVNNATAGGMPSVPTTFDPGALAADTVYYWRVDEFDGSATHKGSVWSLRTMPDIPLATDPNFIGWWKLDEGIGNKALDWSGHGNHGTLRGDAKWEPAGYDGGAINLDGSGDYIDTGKTPATLKIDVNKARTVTAWVYTRAFNNGGIYTSGTYSDNQSFSLRTLTTTNRWRLQYYGTANDYDFDFTALNRWVHFAHVHDGTRTKIYGNGALIVDVARTLNTTNTVTFRIGDYSSAQFNGLIDDVRLYNRALSATEIPDTMRGDPKLAWNASPTNGSTVEIRRISGMSWSKGDSATQHDVYFGTDLAVVTDATTSSPEYKGRQAGTTWSLAGKIAFDTGPFYWRIDEINTDATISKGRIWSFTVADYLILDDMEDYNNFPPDRIFETWIDGWGNQAVNGAIVGHPEPDFSAGQNFAETVNIHAGKQSMPYYYNCNFKYSEATMTLAGSNRDWTQQDAKSLTVWLRGYPATQGSFVEGPAGTYTMTGAGGDIWNISTVEADEFHYAWKRLSGPGTITAKISAISNQQRGVSLNEWAKAGVMIRESLDPNSAHAFMLLSGTSTQGIAFQYRPSAAGTSTTAQQKNTIHNRPLWLRLDRAFDGTFTASHANDMGGAPDKWTNMTTSVIQMAADVYIGLALTSHQRYAKAQVTFSNVTLSGNVTGAAWTDQDIGIISNQAERMFVSIANATGQPAIVFHPDPNAILSNTWAAWNIALGDFAGINLSNVDRISIGFGTKGNTSPGGSGLVYFDDVRLYRARCFPTLVKPTADFSNNCVVDMADIDLMGNNWLTSTYQVTPVAPSNAGLVAYYALENNTNDGSGNAHNGDPCGAPTYVSGPAGYGKAMLFNGQGNQWVDLETFDPSTGTGQLTVSLWAKWNGLSLYYQGLMGKRDTWSATDMMWQIEANRDTGVISFSRNGSSPDCGGRVLPLGQWAHVAVTFNGTTATFYINGEKTGSGAFTFGSDPVSRMQFGSCQANGGNPFNGALDEVRLHNRPLSQAEVAYLAGRTAFTQPLVSLLRPQDPNMDMNADSIINFKDYASVLQTWLEEKLWP